MLILFRPRSFQRGIDGVRTLPPKSRKRGSKRDFFSLYGTKVNFSRIKSATEFLCVNTSSGKVVVIPIPASNGP